MSVHVWEELTPQKPMMIVCNCHSRGISRVRQRSACTYVRVFLIEVLWPLSQLSPKSCTLAKRKRPRPATVRIVQVCRHMLLFANLSAECLKQTFPGALVPVVERILMKPLSWVCSPSVKNPPPQKQRDASSTLHEALIINLSGVNWTNFVLFSRRGTDMGTVVVFTSSCCCSAAEPSVSTSAAHPYISKWGLTAVSTSWCLSVVVCLPLCSLNEQVFTHWHCKALIRAEWRLRVWAQMSGFLDRPSPAGGSPVIWYFPRPLLTSTAPSSHLSFRCPVLSQISNMDETRPSQTASLLPVPPQLNL